MRNHGINVFHPFDCTRTVTASQQGQRSSSGRIQRKNIVAKMMRRTKNPRMTTPSHSASDMALEPLLDGGPKFHFGDAVHDGVNHDFGALGHEVTREVAGGRDKILIVYHVPNLTGCVR